MPLINLVIVLIVVGVLLWMFNAYVTIIDGRIKQIINIVVILCVVLWILQLFIGPSLSSIRIGR